MKLPDVCSALALQTLYPARAYLSFPCLRCFPEMSNGFDRITLMAWKFLKLLTESKGKGTSPRMLGPQKPKQT